MSYRVQNSWAARVIVISMAMLVMAVGFCLFDKNDHDGTDDHASVDLCLGMLTASLLVVLSGTLAWTGIVGTDVVALRSLSPHVPAPPPKLLS